AARVDSRLLAALARIDESDRPMAETYRRLGLVADALAVPRPSYERVRYLIHEHRRQRLRPGVGDLLLDIAFRNRPPDAVIDFILDRRA
ncbi:MAG TPA: hypothetical protein VLJ76_07870, partial [Gaiellaceae bacterium]|nr:hypothetical protein [Gaiellaceae bacterium]